MPADNEPKQRLTAPRRGPRGSSAALGGQARLAIISDTHLPRGTRALPRRCVAEIRAADALVHAGDLRSLAFLQELLALGTPLTVVRGNVDEPALLERLPESAELALAGVRIGVVHDAGPAKGRLERLRARFPACSAAIFGHSHIPLYEQRDGFQIFNPGSPTDRRRQPEHTMGRAIVRAGVVTFELIPLGR